jgi:hypothetical protein
MKSINLIHPSANYTLESLAMREQVAPQFAGAKRIDSVFRIAVQCDSDSVRERQDTASVAQASACVPSTAAAWNH